MVSHPLHLLPFPPPLLVHSTPSWEPGVQPNSREREQTASRQTLKLSQKIRVFPRFSDLLLTQFFLHELGDFCQAEGKARQAVDIPSGRSPQLIFPWGLSPLGDGRRQGHFPKRSTRRSRPTLGAVLTLPISRGVGQTGARDRVESGGP